jgi:hypothetical protein
LAVVMVVHEPGGGADGVVVVSLGVPVCDQLVVQLGVVVDVVMSIP